MNRNSRSLIMKNIILIIIIWLIIKEFKIIKILVWLIIIKKNKFIRFIFTI